MITIKRSDVEPGEKYISFGKEFTALDSNGYSGSCYSKIPCTYFSFTKDMKLVGSTDGDYTVEVDRKINIEVESV